MDKNIISLLKKSGLVGRSGSGFPTWRKWQLVRDSHSTQKYVICNASEGEPNVFKDELLLEKYAPDVIEGIKIALKTVGATSAYIYLNEDYYQRFRDKLLDLVRNLPIELYRKPQGYLAGEETTLLNIIEGQRLEPRIKPPFPTDYGLWGRPTLINNVETFYWMTKIAQGKYKRHRLYCLDGQIANKGVFELPEDWTIEKILLQTDNWPCFEFFIQAGGGASGAIMLADELKQPLKGAGSIIVYDKKETDPFSLMKKWADFFLQGNCDRCTPCREGIYRINEMLTSKKFNQTALPDIFAVLEKTSLCPLGRIAVTSFKTAIEKLL